MPKVNKKIVTTLTVEFDGKNLEITHEPANEAGLKLEKLPDGTYMAGYLVRDTDCQNPMDDCDGMGKIVATNRRGNNWALYQACGLSQYGELLNLEEGEEHTCPNPYGVLLDGDPDEWTIRGPLCSVKLADLEAEANEADGIWLPKNKCDDEEIEHRVRKACYKPSLSLEELKKHYPKVVEKLIPEVLTEYAQSCLDPYNEWASGDNYGVVLDRFDAAGERIEDQCDACWGYVGHKWAMQDLEERMEYYRPDPSKEVSVSPPDCVVA